MNDAELLQRYVRDRDEAAFAELVRRQVDFVYATALRRLRGDAAEAGEVTQLVFIDLARRAGRVAGYACVKAWLHEATRFAVAKRVRAKDRRRAAEARAAQDAAVFAGGAGDASEGAGANAADWVRVAPLLDEALDDLKDADRAAVLLRFFEGRAFAEVGAGLGVAENAARMRTERALEKLRRALAKRGVTSSAGALGLALANQTVVAAPVGVTAAASAAGAAVLAGGVGVGGMAAGASIFMSTIKGGTAAWVLGAAVVAGGAGWWLGQRSAHAHGDAAGATAERSPASDGARDQRREKSAAAVAESALNAAQRVRSLETENAALRAEVARLKGEVAKGELPPINVLTDLASAGAAAGKGQRRMLELTRALGGKVPKAGEPGFEDYVAVLDDINMAQTGILAAVTSLRPDVGDAGATADFSAGQLGGALALDAKQAEAAKAILAEEFRRAYGEAATPAEGYAKLTAESGRVWERLRPLLNEAQRADSALMYGKDGRFFFEFSLLKPQASGAAKR